MIPSFRCLAQAAMVPEPLGAQFQAALLTRKTAMVAMKEIFPGFPTPQMRFAMQYAPGRYASPAAPGTCLQLPCLVFHKLVALGKLII